MQRYQTISCTSAVNNGAVGGVSGKDPSRTDSSSLPNNIQLNSRRSSHVTPYKLKCEKEPLNSRLGPPDYHPQTPNCPEETLTKEYVLSGYRETVEGLEESREVTLTQVQAFTKPVVLKCREAIRKCYRAINDSRAQKRKAGQVYGVPLSGSLVTRPGVFPEQKLCGEEYKKKWIEALSLQHKRLSALADQVPHGYRKKSLFEVLIRNNVPMLRATWFIKVTYLNQFRPGSAALSSGAPDKSQLIRTDIWTKDVIEYLQYLLDEFSSRHNSYSAPANSNRSQQMLYTGSVQQKNFPASAVFDGEEPSLHYKWWYVVRLLQWHHAGGLLLPSLIIDWILNQLQEKEMIEILQLLLPITYGLLETVVLSQTYVRRLVGVAIRFIQQPSPSGSDLVDNSRRAYTVSALVEMVRYLIQAVPDTFVALDCFPLPPCVVSYGINDGSFMSKTSEDVGKNKSSLTDAAFGLQGRKGDALYQSLSFDHIISTIQKSADDLAKSASPGYPQHNEAKSVQALDKALSHGDIRAAYKHLFEDLCDGAVDKAWIAEITPCLRSSLKWIGAMGMSFICSVFFLCEWATCDFRDFRNAAPHDVKFTGRHDFSQVYMAIQLLKLKNRDLQRLSKRKNEVNLGINGTAQNLSQLDNFSSRNVGNTGESRSSIVLSDMFESPGPLHDILVCWIDQHEVQKGEGFKRVQLLMLELVRSGIFYPQAYVRQLIVSGITDTNGPVRDLERRKRHHRILKQLPGMFISNALEEAKFNDDTEISECTHIYSSERRLVLHDLLSTMYDIPIKPDVPDQKRKRKMSSGKYTLVDKLKSNYSASNSLLANKVKSKVHVDHLKGFISALLHFPSKTSSSIISEPENSQVSVKRPYSSIGDKIELAEGALGCDDCRREKRQKICDEKGSCNVGQSPIPSDDEDTWWMRKGPKSVEPMRVDPPPKSIKQASRGRQKNVRKTQSLAHLQNARIEGSQGASTSHVCENKGSCPHHRSGTDGETFKAVDALRTTTCGDIVSIGKSLKQLRCVEKRDITVWLTLIVRQLVEDTEKLVRKVGQQGRTVPIDESISVSWKLGEDELSAILYLLDVSDDLVSAVKFLLWLFPKAISSSSATIQSGRNLPMLPKNGETQACEVGEAFLLSSLRRYENTLIAANLIPEALSASMQRAASIMACNGRLSASLVLHYARHLLKKYGTVAGVVEWEKSFKTTCDKRLFSELDPARLMDMESGFSLGVPAGVEDPDDYLRQKICSGRPSRVGLSMRDVVQRRIEEALHYYSGKERKLSLSGSTKGMPFEKGDEGYQIAQQIVIGLMDCIRQTGGAAQEGDPSLVSSAVSSIVSNVGLSISKIPDFSSGTTYQNYASVTASSNIAKRILRIHITCLCLLKEALGERQSRVFEIALATEASAALAGVYAPAKASRSQFQSTSELYDSNANMPNENFNSAAKLTARATKLTGSLSAFVIGAIIRGVTTLERMVSLLKLKEGLDLIPFVRGVKSSSNGSARSTGAFKAEYSIEVHVHWFRLLVGNCRTVCDGLLVELLGEPCIVAFSRMQRLLPLNLVLPPAHSIFAFVLWRPFIINSNTATREDIHHFYQSLTIAIVEAVKHRPFRDVCLRDAQGFYDLVSADCTDADFAAIIETNGLDLQLKSRAFVPLRGRLFINTIIDCKLPSTIVSQDDENRVSGHVQHLENVTKLSDKLVHVLDSLQPAKFHWQWIELRLLLNEQARLEKLENHDMSIADAIRSSSPSPEKAAASENENNFIGILLTRLLVRPDAVSLLAEVVHLFGRSLEDEMLMQVKWFLAGHDVLYGRKTIRQKFINIAHGKGLSSKVLFWKPWGWSNSVSDPAVKMTVKIENVHLEEGEMVEEGMELKRGRKGSSQIPDEVANMEQQLLTERALIELVLPCIDQSSDDKRSTFANDLIKQLGNIELYVSSVSRGASKPAGASPSGAEGPVSKGSSRKGIRGGASPGTARRPSAAADSIPPATPIALRASISLRLQFLVRLLPIICADREPSAKNMRYMLAAVIVRLLGSRVVYEDSGRCFPSISNCQTKREGELQFVPSLVPDLSADNLFDRLLFVLHGLLSSYQPSWLRSKLASNLPSESSKDISPFDRDVTESLQNDLDRMQLPEKVRWRIQTAMPILFPSGRCNISCQPPSVPTSALTALQPSITIPGFQTGSLNPPQKIVTPTTRITAKTKQTLPQQETEMEIDPWMLLEDAVGSGDASGSTSSDHGNLRGNYWLKGAVRVRRTNLSYIGTVDEDN